VIFLSKSHVFTRVFDELARREGQEVTLPTLESLTGIPGERIRAAIANARKNRQEIAEQIVVMKLGRSWKFTRVPVVIGEYTVEKALEEVNMGSAHIWKHVLKALQESSGIVSNEFLAQRVNEAGETTLTSAQVTTAMYTILSKPEIARNIDVVWSGRSWQYNGSAKGKKKAGVEPHENVSSSIRSSVLRYFAGRPGDLVFVDDVVNDLGFTRKQVQSAVYNLVQQNSNVKNDFEVVQQGHSWRYIPNRAATNGQVTESPTKIPALALSVAAEPMVKAHVPDIPPAQSAEVRYAARLPEAKPEPAPKSTGGRVFEEVDELKDGALLIRDSDNKLYRATEI
jgi:hypothetical protein